HDGARSAGDGRSAWIETGLEALQPPPVQLWRVSGPVEYARSGIFTTRVAPGLAMLAVDLPDNEDPETTAAELYLQIIETARRLACPNLIRIWQYLPRITEALGGENRYRSWCAGRARAFATAGASETALPAACLLGDAGERILLYALASATPGLQVENPRQQSAFRYPPRYGRQPPSFSRATAYPGDKETTLFISGTSSITGHASRHSETLDQLEETLANLEALVSHWGRAAGLAAIAPMKVYLRHRSDLEAVRAALAKRLPRDHPVVYLHADVCRAELNVEIEGIVQP
ncbi:MAG: hypothetical protein ACREFZ_11140, partial [Acetobacteraceae bacterium]